MDTMKRTLKIIFIVILALAAMPVALLVGTQLWFYASYPIYSFEEPKPFSGTTFYNPYAACTDSAWKKCIFHVHTKSWLGVTNGENNRRDLLTTYHGLKFDVVAISNYMKVDTAGAADPAYIPCYEHGYGYGKTHQLVMGNRGRVLWRDYVFIQNLSQKQYTLDLLKARCDMLAVNHPDLRYGYEPDDFKYLSNYDIFEVLNGARLSLQHWDAALTHGHTAWLTANDDSHNVHDPATVQQVAVFIQAPTTHRADILNNLGRGAAFGIHFTKTAPVWEKKHDEANLVSFPQAVEVRGDTLHVLWQKTMSRITFVGDGGETLKDTTHTDRASYAIKPTDTYVRVTLEDPDGLVYYLNPIVRSANGEMPAKQFLASVNTLKTGLKRFIIVVSLLLLWSLGNIVNKKAKQIKTKKRTK
jgi:hypothetical protein